jgi:hypothetical protein
MISNIKILNLQVKIRNCLIISKDVYDKIVTEMIENSFLRKLLFDAKFNLGLNLLDTGAEDVMFE